MTRKIAIVPMVKIIRREKLDRYDWIPYITDSFNGNQLSIDKIELPKDAVACGFYYNYVDVETQKIVAKDCFQKGYFIGDKEDIFRLGFEDGDYEIGIGNLHYHVYQKYSKPIQKSSKFMPKAINLKSCKQFDTQVSDVTYGMRMSRIGYYANISSRSINGLKTNPILSLKDFNFPADIFKFFVFREDHFPLETPEGIDPTRKATGVLAKKITPNVIVGTRITEKNVDSIFTDDYHESVKQEIKSGGSFWYQVLFGPCTRKNKTDYLLQPEYLTIDGKKPTKSRNFEYLLKDEKTPQATAECDLGK